MGVFYTEEGEMYGEEKNIIGKEKLGNLSIRDYF